MRDVRASIVEDHRRVIASSEAVIARETQAAAEAAERVEIARQRVATLTRGDSVGGGLGKKLDVIAMMKKAGVTPRMMKRMRSLADLTPTEFESLLQRTDAAQAADKAFDRELRRLIRARDPRRESP